MRSARLRTPLSAASFSRHLERRASERPLGSTSTDAAVHTCAKASMRHALETLHQKFKKPILVAEFGADCLAGLHSLPAEQWSEEYQADLIMTLIDVIRECDFVVGEHVWNFADFRTAQNFPRAGGNKKGAFTRDRQPKMVAHFLRRRWAVPRYDVTPPAPP